MFISKAKEEATPVSNKPKGEKDAEIPPLAANCIEPDKLVAVADLHITLVATPQTNPYCKTLIFLVVI